MLYTLLLCVYLNNSRHLQRLSIVLFSSIILALKFPDFLNVSGKIKLFALTYSFSSVVRTVSPSQNVCSLLVQRDQHPCEIIRFFNPATFFQSETDKRFRDSPITSSFYSSKCWCVYRPPSRFICISNTWGQIRPIKYFPPSRF